MFVRKDSRKWSCLTLWARACLALLCHVLWVESEAIVLSWVLPSMLTLSFPQSLLWSDILHCGFSLTPLLSAVVVWCPHFGSLPLVSYQVPSLFSRTPPEVGLFYLLVCKLREFLFPLYKECSTALTFLCQCSFGNCNLCPGLAPNDLNLGVELHFFTACLVTTMTPPLNAVGLSHKCLAILAF